MDEREWRIEENSFAICLELSTRLFETQGAQSLARSCLLNWSSNATTVDSPLVQVSISLFLTEAMLETNSHVWNDSTSDRSSVIVTRNSEEQ